MSLTWVKTLYHAAAASCQLLYRELNDPAAISPVWCEQPERLAALAMLTVVGLLVYAVIQRQVRLYLRDHH